MKAVCIIGMSNGFYGRASRIVGAVNSALGELGLSVAPINVIERRLPYYDEGNTVESFAEIAGAIKDAKNIILAYNVTEGTPSAVMKVFMEYLADKNNGRLFENKKLLNISISATDGEREAAEYVAGVFGSLGAFELVRICIGGESLGAILSGALPIDTVEKYAEDYYRLLRQNRVFLRPSCYRPEKAVSSIGRLPSEDLSSLKAQVETSMKRTLQSSIAPTERGKVKDIIGDNEPEAFGNDFFMEYVSELKEPAAAPQKDFDVFDSKQEEDIEELTKLFSTRLKIDEQASPERSGAAGSAAQSKVKQTYTPQKDFPSAAVQAMPPAADASGKADALFGPQLSEASRKTQHGSKPPVVARNKTCRQMTGSLPHYFQTQLAQDTEAVFQFNIFGEEEFSGYLLIKNRDNEYYDGQYDSPDITIISSAAVWLNVLRGKMTAQKAFMTGQLKVRGNFMLLNRFDQLYKKMS